MSSIEYRRRLRERAANSGVSRVSSFEGVQKVEEAVSDTDVNIPEAGQDGDVEEVRAEAVDVPDARTLEELRQQAREQAVIAESLSDEELDVFVQELSREDPQLVPIMLDELKNRSSVTEDEEAAGE